MNGGAGTWSPLIRYMPTVVVLRQHLQLVDWTLILVGVSSYILVLSFRLLHTYACLSNVHLLPFAESKTAKQRALVRASAVVRKQKEKEGDSSSTPKGITNGSSKQESEQKDNRPLKKGLAFPASGKPKKPSPPKPSHGAGKGLMTATSLVTQGTIHRLLTNKEHIIEMTGSIIKDTDLDPCAE